MAGDEEMQMATDRPDQKSIKNLGGQNQSKQTGSNQGTQQGGFHRGNSDKGAESVARPQTQIAGKIGGNFDDQEIREKDAKTPGRTESGHLAGAGKSSGTGGNRGSNDPLTTPGRTGNFKKEI